MHLDTYDYGIVLTVIGLFMSFWKLKRKFDRTNASGVEQFPSFAQKMVATTFDGILYRVGLASLFVGLFILGFG